MNRRVLLTDASQHVLLIHGLTSLDALRISPGYPGLLVYRNLLYIKCSLTLAGPASKGTPLSRRPLTCRHIASSTLSLPRLLPRPGLGLEELPGWHLYFRQRICIHRRIVWHNPVLVEKPCYHRIDLVRLKGAGRSKRHRSIDVVIDSSSV